MAQTYLMYIESITLEERQETQRLFEEYKFIYVDQKKFELSVQGNGVYMTVIPEGLPDGGIQSVDDCITVSQLGFKLYDILKTASSFKFAQVGYEADNHFEPDGLLKEASYYKDFDGLVISNSIADRESNYSDFERFNATHLWKPYHGEAFVQASKVNGKWQSEVVWSYAENDLDRKS